MCSTKGITPCLLLAQPSPWRSTVTLKNRPRGLHGGCSAVQSLRSQSCARMNVLLIDWCPVHHSSAPWGSSQQGMGDFHHRHFFLFMQIPRECLAACPPQGMSTLGLPKSLFPGHLEPRVCWALGWEEGCRHFFENVCKVFSNFMGRFLKLHNISTPCLSP